MWRMLKGSLAHWPRVVHTMVGVALAVSLVSGTFILTDTIDAAFTDATAPAAGDVDVVVRSPAEFKGVGDTVDEREPMPASVLEKVLAVPGVADAWGTVWGYAQIVGTDGKTIGAKGLPAVGAAWTPEAPLVAGRAPTSPGQVVIDILTAQRNGLSIGDQIKVMFEDAVAEFTIYGLSQVSNLVSSTLATFDLTTAQEMLGEAQRLDAISVRAALGVTADALRSRIGLAIDSEYEVLTADQAAKEAKESWTNALRFLITGLLVFAIVALLVGGFLIFNTFSVLVAQRTQELALLRAVGASRRQVTAAVLAEACVIGLAASVVGVAGGLGAARGLLALMDALGLAVPTTSPVFQPRTALIGLLAGVVVTAVAAVQPARRATRVSPLSGATDGVDDVPGSSRARILVGGGLAVAGALELMAGLYWHAPRPLVAVALGTLALLAGVVALAPVAARPAARLLGLPLVGLWGEPGRLGRENAMRNPRRTAATASALMIGVGLIGVVAILAASMKASATKAIEGAMRADFQITGSAVPGASGGVPPVAAERLRESPAIAAVSEVRTGQWGLDGAAQTLVAIDPSTVTQVYALDADSSAAARQLDDKAVLVRESVAARHGWAVGDPVPMTFARTGTTRMRVVGTYSESPVRSDYVISLKAYEANYTQQLDMEIDVVLAPGLTSSEGRAAIRTALADFPNLSVRNRPEVLAAQAKQVDRMLLPITALLALSIAIALLGIANTLSLSIHQRTRELGMLRAIGMARRQVRSMIRAEAVIIALLGTALGLVVAAFFGSTMVAAMRNLGVTERAVPVGQLLVLALVATLAALVAAALPARRAASLEVLDAVGAD